jgi:hypothetical protein
MVAALCRDRRRDRTRKGEREMTEAEKTITKKSFTKTAASVLKTKKRFAVITG